MLVSALFSDIVAWWKFGQAKPSLTSRHEVVAFLGLLAITATLIFPVVFAFSSSLQQAL